MKAIEEFKSQEQLNTCLRWWKKRLYLDSWNIRAVVTDEINYGCGEQEDVVGLNTLVPESEQSFIQIISRDMFEGGVEKYCAEKILVHELLHCKYAFLENGSTYEGKYLEVMEHRLLEQMARTLILVKYGLKMDYFEKV